MWAFYIYRRHSVSLSAVEEAPVAPAAAASADQVFQMMTGFAATQVLLATDELGIFEALTNGPATAGELAGKLAINADTLERLLVAAGTFGLLVKEGNRFGLSAMAEQHLVKSSPAYMGGLFQHIRHDLYPLWGHLAATVREGGPAWRRIPGMDPAGPFESIYKTPEGVRSFMDAMFTMTYPAACEFAQRFDFSLFRHIVDVGGASGAFFAAVLPNFPGVRGTIFDLPPVRECAVECMEKFGLGDRVDFQAGDFFKDALPQDVDMVVLGYILHDWDTERGTELLKKIHAALKPGGAVFLAEGLFNEDKTGPAALGFMDLNMLVATTGRERTGAEYEQWLREAGFTRTSHTMCSGPKSFVVGYRE